MRSMTGWRPAAAAMLDLTADQLAMVRTLLARRLPQREVRAFGSRVTGRAWRYSDLDLVVMGDPPVADLTLAHLRADFEESDLPFRVDVIEQRDLPAGWPSARGADTVVIRSPSEHGREALG